MLLHVVPLGCPSIGFRIAVVLVVDEQVFRVIYSPALLQWSDVMNDGLRSSIDRLIHVPRVVLGFRHITGQVFEDQGVLEDSCVVLGSAIHILLFLFIHLGLQVLDLRLIVHVLFDHISQLASILSRRSMLL